ncbi:MAG: hypothetical protein AAF340_17610, partial [Pseudomonadota bacterium]
TSNPSCKCTSISRISFNASSSEYRFRAICHPFCDTKIVAQFYGAKTGMGNLLGPVDKLVGELATSWGTDELPAEPSRILHICNLIARWARQVIENEERLIFAELPKPYHRMQELLIGVLSSQVHHFSNLSDALDQAVSTAVKDPAYTPESPLVIDHNIFFDVPPNWSKDMEKEFRKINRHYSENPIYDFRSFKWVIFFLFFVLSYLVVSSMVQQF